MPRAAGLAAAAAAAAAALLTQARPTHAADTRPNFVYVLLDDMDVMLGSEKMVPQTRALVQEQGAWAKNFFVSSPKCTPSRSAWLSGKYYHNLRPHGATSGRGLNTSNFFDANALFPSLHKAGYKTALFGKLHNDQSRWLCGSDNHTEPFTHLETECSPCGGYYATNWVRKSNDGDVTELFNPTDDHPEWTSYSEAQYGNRSIAWIRSVAKQGPFFCYVGTTGPHLGVVPAPWHRLQTESMNVTAPRTPNFNMHAADHHPLLASAPALDDAAIPHVDRHMRDRWGTLMSIDDVVAGLVGVLEETGVLSNTYVLFSSDHGYHLGQFRIPDEKMLPYETDLRVPFYMRGPGIAPGTIILNMTANVDIAPTLLELAGVPIPTVVDGHSMVPLLKRQASSRPWRTSFTSEFAEGGVQQWGTNGMWVLTKNAANGDPSINPAVWMEGVDIHGTNDAMPCPPGTPNASDCEAKCRAANASGSYPCEGWTHHFNRGSGAKSGWRCCMKSHITGLAKSAQTPPLISGCLDPAAVNKSIHGGGGIGNTTYGDGVVNPPFGPSSCSSTKSRDCQYEYDDPTNQWRMLRVINATHNFAYMEWDPAFVFDAVAHAEFYDMTGAVSDPSYNFDHPAWWQMTSTLADLPSAARGALHDELQRYYECKGTLNTPSNCP